MSTFTLVAKYVSIPKQEHEFETLSACIQVNGPNITKVETCNTNDYTSYKKKWKEKYPKATFYEHTLITPAMVDNHTHLAMNIFRDLSHRLTKLPPNMIEDFFFHVESKLNKDDIRAFTRMGAYEAIAHGTGYVWDHYYHPRACAQGLADTGLSGCITGTLQDIYGPGSSFWQSTLEETLALHQESTWSASGVHFGLGPHATDSVSQKLWQEVTSLAQQHKFPIHFHLAQSKQEVQRIFAQHQQTPVQWLQHLGVLTAGVHLRAAHGIYLTHTDLENLRNKLSLIFCPSSAMSFAHPANINHWEHAGVNWCLGTDCAASNDSLNLLKELRIVYGWNSLQNTFNPQQENQIQKISRNALLHKVTSTASHQVPGAPVGIIEPGARANLAFWNIHHPSLWPGREWKAICLSDGNNALTQMMIQGKVFTLNMHKQDTYHAHLEEAEKRFLQVAKSTHIALT
ncbi:MAG: amidohydrolase family protein [Zetaproteobacteria bacterium]|nr:amidohydrolase family protein [Zetaproteobacteria bacterium]